MSAFDYLGGIVSSPTARDETASRDEVDIDIDSALSLLANERRRLTIRFAIDLGGVFNIADVVECIAAHEYGADYTSSERKRVYISLYQTHLPRLVDTGVLERVDDENAHTFRVGESARPLYDVLDATIVRLGGGA